MTELVLVTRSADVSLVTMALPPLNALGHALRTALWNGLTAALAEPATRAVVIAGAGRTFASGADLRDLDRPEAAPTLGDLCALIESAGKPVVAALHGVVLGGGLELALAAHWRVAAVGVRLGLPDVTLGLMPGAGGTQRLPRLVGSAEALRLLLTGEQVPAGEALPMGLIDGMVEGDVPGNAVALARTCGLRPTLQRSGPLKDAAGYLEAVALARSGLGDEAPLAALRIVEAVEAALLLPPAAGLAMEHAAFEECRASAQSAALRHVFVAERRIRVMPEAASEARPLQVVGVVGAGKLGASVALAVIASGLRCVIVERDRPALVAALEGLALAQEDAVAAGQLTPDARDAAWARLAGAANLGALADADLVIEAVPEDRALKASVLGQVGAVLRPGAVIGVTSAGLPLADLARATRRPADVIGLGFPAPVPVARLVELAATSATDAQAMATGLAFLRRMGRSAMRVQAGAAGGLVAERLAGAAQAAADVLAMMGVGSQAIAAALTPAGLGWAVPDAVEASGRARLPDADQMRRRVLWAMVNLGAGMLAAGEVQRPSDLDMLSILTLGLPRAGGGLMRMADSAGILALRRDLTAFAKDDPELWEPHPLIQDLFLRGALFSELNGR